MKRRPRTQRSGVGLHAILDGDAVVGPDVQICTVLLREAERQRWLRQDRRADRRLGQHPQGEATREAHADHTDPRAAAALVLVRGKSLAPGDDRAGPPGRPDAELLRHTRRAERAQRAEDGRRRAWLSEEVRQHGSATCVDDAIGEVDHARRDARHLGDHDHRWPRATPIDVARLATVLEPLASYPSSVPMGPAPYCGRGTRAVASVGMAYETSVHINAPPERVWAVLVDVEAWPTWTDSMREVKLVDGGELEPGSTVRIRQPKLPPATWRVTQLAPGVSFTWEASYPGVKTIAVHSLTARDEGTEVTLAVRHSGPLGPVLGALTAGPTRRYVEMEAQGLKRRSEAEA